MPADLVIFDCDGVLVDSEIIYVETERRCLAQAGLPITRDRYVRTYSGLPSDEWQTRLEEEFRHSTGKPAGDAFFDDIRVQCENAFKLSLVEVSGARGALETLGNPFCVASSSLEDELHWKLRHTGLHDLFAPNVFSTENVENGKPAPDLFLLAAQKMGMPPSSAIVVEDSVNGVAAGKAAGMKVIGFVAGGHCREDHGSMLKARGADVIVGSFSTLAAAIAEQEGRH